MMYFYLITLELRGGGKFTGKGLIDIAKVGRSRLKLIEEAIRLTKKAYGLEGLEYSVIVSDFGPDYIA